MVFLCTLNTLQNTCLRSPPATSQSGATACRCAMLQHAPAAVLMRDDLCTFQ
jgi:hypothetical protein